MVHVIDAVLLPAAEKTTVVDVIVNSEAHSTLEAAVVAAGLAETLAGDGPFTVFAPTDAAFAALPEGTVETLLQDPQGELTQILLYHVVGAKAMSSSLSNGQMVATLQGGSVEVTIDGGNVYINGAMVSTADIETDNGVVHVIDAVLLPDTKTAFEQFVAFENIKTYPNPTINEITVEFKSESTGLVSKSIYDITGRKVIEEKRLNAELGINTIKSNVQNLNPGIYFIKIEGNGSNKIQRFIKN